LSSESFVFGPFVEGSWLRGVADFAGLCRILQGEGVEFLWNQWALGDS
jgi:hypothetical protein